MLRRLRMTWGGSPLTFVIPPPSLSEYVASMPRCTSLSYPPDDRLSRMLITYIATGVAFMLIPGTLVGVMTLLKISASHTAQ